MRVFPDVIEVPVVLRIRGDQSPYAFATVSGIFLGIASCLASLLCLAIVQAVLPKALWGPSAAAPVLSELGGAGLFFVGVLITPFIETLIGQMLPLEVSRGVGLGKAACICVGAFLFGLGHYLNGGLVHGISTFMAGAFFSYAYMAVRQYGYLPSYLASYAAHMTHNFLLMFVFPFLIPSLDK